MRRLLKKRLFAVIMAIVMTIGCASTVFAATSYTASEEDIAAADISDLVFSYEDDDYVGASRLNLDSMDNREALFKFHTEVKKRKLYRLFDSYSADSSGSKLVIADGGITSKSKVNAYQYDSDKKEWKTVGCSKANGKMTLTLKADGPVAITFPEKTTLPGKTDPYSYVMTDTDKAAFNMSNVVVSEDDSTVNVKAMNPEDAASKAMAFRFHNQIEKRDLYRVFDYSGADSEDGSKVKIVDDGINTKQKFTAYQYDKKAQTWKSVSSSKANGKITVTLKDDGPVAITLPAGTKASGSGGGSSSSKAKVTSVDISEDRATMSPLLDSPIHTLQLTSTFEYEGPTTLFPAVWSSSNKKVATVDPNTGLVTAHKSGTANIKVKHGNKSKTCKITVVKEDVQSITVDSSIAPENGVIHIRPGDALTLTAIALPEQAYNRNVKWEFGDYKTSCDKNVFTKSNKGKNKCVIKLKKEGKNGAQVGDTIEVKAVAKDGSGVVTTVTIAVTHS